MRKTFVILTGCILLCGLVAAMVAVPPPTPTVTVTINLNTATDGVDTPWFELSRGAAESVQWVNNTNYDCTVSFGNKKFLNYRDIAVPKNGKSVELNAKNAQGPPPGWKGGVYLFYKYSVSCGDAGYFDPGGGVRP